VFVFGLAHEQKMHRHLRIRLFPTIPAIPGGRRFPGIGLMLLDDVDIDVDDGGAAAIEMDARQ
jgi:hypothetical protein